MRKAGFDSVRKGYCFDHIEAKPNRFSGRGADDTVVVVLDPDVSKCSGRRMMTTVSFAPRSARCRGAGRLAEAGSPYRGLRATLSAVAGLGEPCNRPAGSGVGVGHERPAPRRSC